MAIARKKSPAEGITPAKPYTLKDLREFRSLAPPVFAKWIESWGANLYRRGDVLFYEGNAPLGLFFISSGRVKLVSGRGCSKQQILRVACAPALLGERCLLIDVPYAATAQVLEESRVCFLPAARFHALWNSEPAVPRLFARLLAARLGETQRDFVDLGSNTVRERLARLILRFQDESGGPGAPIHLAASRQELAEMLATSAEVVCRTIGELEGRSIIAIDGPSIRVLDAGRLRQIARLPR